MNSGADAPSTARTARTARTEWAKKAPSILFILFLAVSAVAALVLLAIRVRSADDLLKAWPATATALLAAGVLIPEVCRADWFSRAGVRLTAGALILILGLVTAASQIGFTTPVRKNFDVDRHEAVVPGQPVTFNVSDLPAADEFVVTLQVRDHDVRSSSTEFCQNEVTVSVSAILGVAETRPTVTRLRPHLHRFTVGPVRSGQDIRIIVSYAGSEPTSNCSEDILLESAIVE